MVALYLIIHICNAAIPLRECDAATARATIRGYAPEGQIVCIAPTMMVAKGSGPDASEYARVHCELRERRAG
jgi:hypothetical protein